MNIEIITKVLGALENNTYIIADPSSREAVVIDPSFGSEIIGKEIQQRNWHLNGIWLTHAHFDHTYGTGALTRSFPYPVPIGIHPADLELWNEGGGGRLFGIEIEAGPEPTLYFTHSQKLLIGKIEIEVRHTPGHTAGHVVLYAPKFEVVFCGDLIFYHGIGRTDMPGGSQNDLLNSIRSQVLTLPPQTRLLSGHGPETTVGEEMTNNPFLR
jgi:hydroxyacylglutathione hydrolase